MITVCNRLRPKFMVRTGVYVLFADSNGNNGVERFRLFCSRHLQLFCFEAPVFVVLLNQGNRRNPFPVHSIGVVWLELSLNSISMVVLCVVSVLDCKSQCSGFKLWQGQKFGLRFLLHLRPLADSAMMSTLTAHCQWEDETARERTGRPPSYAVAKKYTLQNIN